MIFHYFFRDKLVLKEHSPLVCQEDLCSSDPQAHHVVIADQAGFHPRKGDERLPEGVHIVSLPPYSLELNP